jgi:heat shock protein HslJ
VITDIDWNMTGLGERTNPLGAGGKQVTLRLDADTQRAAGFGGCNRYSGSYSLRGDSLSFGAVLSTRMACTDGMELEGAWHKTLPRVVTYSATESTLTLNATEGPVASFHK